MDILYEIITPQTAAKYKMTTLSYGDELELQSSVLASPTGIISHFNNTLFKCAKEKPQEIKDFNDFLQKTTITDRVALVAGLYHVTYGDEYITDTICPQCRTKNTSKVKLSKFANVNSYNGKPFEFLSKIIQEKLPVSGYEITLSPATLDKEQRITEENELYNFPASIVHILQYLDSIKLSNDHELTHEKIVDLVSLIKTLSPKDVRYIKNRIADIYLKYSFDIKYKVQCSNCKHIYVQTMDFVEQFLRMVVEA